MKQLAQATAAAVFRPPVAALAAMLLIGTAALAAGPTPAAPPDPSNSNYCLMVRNTAAQQQCQTSRNQFYANNFRASLATMKKALSASPKEGVIHAMIARIMIRMGDQGGAERELRQARKNGAPDSVVLPVLFQVMVERHEEINLLNEFFDPAASAKGQAPADILYGRALALQSLGRVPEAVAAVDRSLSLSRSTDSLLLRAKLAGQQKDDKLVRKLVDEAYRLNPKNGPVLGAKLDQVERAGDPAATIAFGDQVLKLFPRSGEARGARIRAFLKRNEDARAKAEVNALLAVSPSSPLAGYYNAVLLSRAKDKKGAFEGIQALPPEFVKMHPEFTIDMAQIASDNGKEDRAAAILGAGLGADPSLVDVRLRLATLRMRQNSPQAALIVLSPAKDSPDPRVQKLLGEVKARVAKDRAF